MKPKVSATIFLAIGTAILGGSVGCALSNKLELGIVLMWTGCTCLILSLLVMDKPTRNNDRELKRVRAERNAAIADVEQIISKCMEQADNERAISVMCKGYCSNYHRNEKGIVDCFDYSEHDMCCCKNFKWKGV